MVRNFSRSFSGSFGRRKVLDNNSFAINPEEAALTGTCDSGKFIMSRNVACIMAISRESRKAEK